MTVNNDSRLGPTECRLIKVVEMKPKLAKSGRPSPNPQVAISSSKPVEFRFQALEQDNRGLKQENHEMKEKIRGLMQENHRINSLLLTVSLSPNNADNIRLMTLLKQLTKSHNRLYLRALFDKSRDFFASRCGYAGWDEMRGALGHQGAKMKMQEVLKHDENQTLPATASEVVNLIIDNNYIRSGGNDVAHSATSREVSAAVGSLRLGKNRTISEYLQNLLYTDEDEFEEDEWVENE